MKQIILIVASLFVLASCTKNHNNDINIAEQRATDSTVLDNALHTAGMHIGGWYGYTGYGNVPYSDTFIIHGDYTITEYCRGQTHNFKFWANNINSHGHKNFAFVRVDNPLMNDSLQWGKIKTNIYSALRDSSYFDNLQNGHGDTTYIFTMPKINMSGSLHLIITIK